MIGLEAVRDKTDGLISVSAVRMTPLYVNLAYCYDRSWRLLMSRPAAQKYHSSCRRLKACSHYCHWSERNWL